MGCYRSISPWKKRLCLVWSSPPRLISFFSGARTHSNNTAEMIASFLGPLGPIARDTNSCIYECKHVAGVCLGTIQARTHVQLALACQRSTLYGHTGSLGNECVDLVKTTPQKTRFRSVTIYKICKEFTYR